MAGSVTLTAALRANLLSLQGTARLLDQTQLRLSTGRKVNSALDNPSSFFASQALNNRARDLSNLLDSMGQGIQVLKAADQGITSLTSMVEQAQAIAQSANNSVTNSGAFRSGDIAAAAVNDLTAAAGTLVMTAESGGTAVATATITVAAGDTLADVAAAINNVTGFSATIVDGSSSSTAGSKRLEIRATNGNDLNIAAGVVATYLNANNDGGTGGSAGLELETGGAYTIGNDIAATLNTSEQVALEKQFSTLRTQMDSLIRDSGYQGTNLLNGDSLTVQFNEKNTSKLTVTGTELSANNLGIQYTEDSTFLSQNNINASISQINSALNTLRTQASTFGNTLNIIQTRQDFTNNLINTLKGGSDLLTLADNNEEGANLLALQTSQQLGIQALSLASQANQSVLRLFG